MLVLSVRMNVFRLSSIALFLSSCVLVSKPSPSEMAMLTAPPPNIEQKTNILAPKALQWFQDIERDYAGKGRPLSSSELRYAESIGIKRANEIQIIIADRFPMPLDPELDSAVRTYGMGGPSEGGRTMDHNIFIKPEHASSVTVITHELNHVAQFERLGVPAMIRQYLIEMQVLGYARSPLELEAYARQVDQLN